MHAHTHSRVHVSELCVCVLQTEGVVGGVKRVAVRELS